MVLTGSSEPLITTTLEGFIARRFAFTCIDMDGLAKAIKPSVAIPTCNCHG